MAHIRNVDYRKFRQDVKDKKIVLWGAGRLASYYLKTFCRGLDISFIVDQNEELWGKELAIEEDKYLITNEKELIHKIEKDSFREKISIFITPTAYAGEIIKHINELPMLDNMDCYAGVLMRDYYEARPFSFSEGSEKIPRKIHYCWFGRKEIPDHLKRYMETWHKFCPDYEIIRWDESNYDISKNQYMREAYECKKWGFVPDYARLDIIYNEGGVYLDTDVELLAPLDRLLKDEMFCGFSCNFQIGIGVGFGAIKGHVLVKELRDYYENLSFYQPNGKMNLKTCYEYQHPVFEKFGFTLENIFQKKNNVVLYPSEVLSPDAGLISQNYSDKTVSVHHFEYSWASKREKEAMNELKKELADKAIHIETE